MMPPGLAAVTVAAGVWLCWGGFGAVAGYLRGNGVRRRALRSGVAVDPRPWVRWWGQLIRSRRSEARARLRSEQLPALVGAIERSLHAGASIREAVLTAAQLVGGPLADELERLARRVDAGMPLGVAMRRWADESGCADIGLVAAACELGAELGRGTAAALAGVAVTLEHRRDLAADATTAAAQARASAGLLTVLPIVFVAGSTLIDTRLAATLLWTPFGWMCLATAITLDLLGMAWMRRQIRAAT